MCHVKRRGRGREMPLRSCNCDLHRLSLHAAHLALRKVSLDLDNLRPLRTAGTRAQRAMPLYSV
jgi:hypothetical protein